MKLFEIGFVTVRLVDILDISIVSFLLYKLYDILKGSLALRVLGVILTIFLLWKIVAVLDFVLLKTILDQFLGLGAISLVIIFAPEIRKFLTAISKNTLLDRLIRQFSTDITSSESQSKLTDAVSELLTRRSGALILVTANDSLEEIKSTGERLNADISSRLIASLFQKTSPLHDGAMIITGDKIVAAKCILPLSNSQTLPIDLGLRHRAALGISEQSDVMVIVVSEEKREISIAKGGVLRRKLNLEELSDTLLSHAPASQT